MELKIYAKLSTELYILFKISIALILCKGFTSQFIIKKELNNAINDRDNLLDN